uniref:Uncharacterized protein n=1 Tax=Branchiostoma floridae TaxID=7739 RepID=C3ZUR0_BRAFL|eukprot:XP_002587761.1 hypothetical protein BRAFLDRAFT_94665 [Branchiostoma floridae]
MPSSRQANKRVPNTGSSHRKKKCPDVDREARTDEGRCHQTIPLCQTGVLDWVDNYASSATQRPTCNKGLPGTAQHPAFLRTRYPHLRNEALDEDIDGMIVPGSWRNAGVLDDCRREGATGERATRQGRELRQ